MPGKAAWLRFETNPSFHFDFFLAEKLGMTVHELRARMSAQEWLEWSIYYGRAAQQRQLAQAKTAR